MKKSMSKLLVAAALMTSLLPTTAFAAQKDIRINNVYFYEVDRESQQVTIKLNIENRGSVTSSKVGYTLNNQKQSVEVNNLQPNEKRELTEKINIPNAYRYDLTAEILDDGLLNYTSALAVAYAEMQVGVFVNGMKVDFPDVQPFIDKESNRTMVPVRFVAEALGAKVEWDAANQTVRMDKEGKQINLRIGERKATVDGKEITFDSKAIMKDSRTFVPLRFISETFGAKVEWDAKTLTVKITTASGGNNTIPTNGTTPTNGTGTNPTAGTGEKVGASDQFTVVSPSYPEMLLPKDPVTEPSVEAFLDSLDYKNGVLSGKIPNLPEGHVATLSYTTKSTYQDLTGTKEGQSFSINIGQNEGKVVFVIYQGNNGKNEVYITFPAMTVEWGSKR